MEIKHFHLFCGAGGGGMGFNQGQARVGTLTARFRCLGGVDVDAAAVRDFTRLVGVPGTCLDLFNREQYAAFHGREPGPDWREATPQDLHRAASGEAPDIVFLSAPCKGFSGLLNATSAASDKYQALNGLALRGLCLLLAAWGDDPPPLILFENVPRIAQRGRHLLDQITGLLEGHGYAVALTTHDCGELGGLAQHRKRFLLVARHKAKVPAFLYQPPKRRVRAIGEVLGALPMPEAEGSSPMHRLPRLTWDTWVRLALIPAGGDWRDLPGRKGTAAEYQQYGVVPWGEPAHTVTGQSAPGGGPNSVADPRWRGGILGVQSWDEASGTVTGRANPTTGAFSVADPRTLKGDHYHNVYRVVPWGKPAGCVTSAGRPAGGAVSVADPRVSLGQHANKMRVEDWQAVAHTVTGSDRVGSGAPSVNNPRPWAGAGHYGVIPWTSPSGAVTAQAGHDNGKGNVADPRVLWTPPADVPLILALDGTWHRPLTTLDLAALQGFPVEDLTLDGKSHTRWREAIGNAVPPPAATAIAGVMGQVLLMARSGQTFALSSAPIWVRKVAMGLAVDL